MCRLVIGISLSLIIGAAQVVANELPLTSDKKELPEFLYRYGVYEEVDCAELIDNPTRISRTVEAFEEQEQRRLLTDSDFHLVTRVPLQKIIWVLTRHQSFHEFYKRIAISEDRTPTAGPYEYHQQRALAVAKAFGIEKSYDYILNIHTSGEGTHEFFQKWNLETSLDERLYAVYGSWYLTSIEIGGETYTYMRYFYCTGFQEVPIGLEMVMKSFMDMDIKTVLKETVRAATAYAP